MHSMMTQKDAGLGADRSKAILWSVIVLGIGFALGASFDPDATDHFDKPVEISQTTPPLADWHGNVKRSNWSEAQ